MATIHQIEANRLNAQKSTGPRSVNGKATSSMNALKSGIDAKSIVIRGENVAELKALTAEYLDRFHPTTPEQRLYVDTLIRGDWQLRRLARVDAQIWEYEMSSASHLDEDSPLGHAFERGERTFERLQRRINAIERSYKSALHELQQLQPAHDTQPHTQPDAQPIPIPTAQPQETKPTSSRIGFVAQCDKPACVKNEKVCQEGVGRGSDQAGYWAVKENSRLPILSIHNVGAVPNAS
jgi:hypothetical protein